MTKNEYNAIIIGKELKWVEEARKICNECKYSILL